MTKMTSAERAKCELRRPTPVYWAQLDTRATVTTKLLISFAPSTGIEPAFVASGYTTDKAKLSA